MVGLTLHAFDWNPERVAGYDTTHLSLLLRLRDRTDQLSWREFHEKYGKLLHRYARGRGASPEDADDIVQEVEVAVFKAMDGFTYDAGKGRFRAYLRAAVVNMMGRRAAKDARQAASLDPRTLDYAAAIVESGQDGQWEHEWRLHRLRLALHAVAPEFEPSTLEAFRMHVLQGASVKETTAKLGLSADSIYQAKSRVLRRVREQIELLDPDM